MAAEPNLVLAAGGVLITERVSAKGNRKLRVAVVHRPSQDDWSFPKGKLDEGESLEQCALREVEEETGYRCELGNALSGVRYVDRQGRPKSVSYWVMSLISGTFAPNSEVDELVWLGPKKAARLLSYDVDRSVLGEALRTRGESDWP